MKTHVHCSECETRFTIESVDEPQFCCFCQEPIILDFEEEETEEVEEEETEDSL